MDFLVPVSVLREKCACLPQLWETWSILVRGSRELLQCGISYFLQRSSTSEMKQRAPVSYRATERLSISDLSQESYSNVEVPSFQFNSRTPTSFLDHLLFHAFPPQICPQTNWEIDALSALWESLNHTFPTWTSLSNSVKQLTCLMSGICCNLTDWTALQRWGFLLCHSWVPHSQLQSTIWTHCSQPHHLLFMIPLSVLCLLMSLSYLLCH